MAHYRSWKVIKKLFGIFVTSDARKKIRQGQVIKQRERKVFRWTPEFVSVKLSYVKNTIKLGKFSKSPKVTAKPKVMENLRRLWKKFWKSHGI